MLRKWFSISSRIGLAALFAASPLFMVTAAQAATPAAQAASPAAKSANGQGLEISPPVIELSANPGDTLTTSIRIRNVTSGQLIAKGKADDFGAGSGEDGQPKLLLDETGSTRFSLKYWVQGVPDLLLAPQELKITTIKIVVPKNAEPGGHFGVVRFTAVPPELDGTGVSLSASIGALILLKVSGAITEKVSLSEFSTSQSTTEKGKPPVVRKGSFFEHGPIDFLVRLHNEGSVHEKVTGTITVKDWTDKKVDTLQVNDKGGNVLPDSIRRFDVPFPQKQLFGHYTAALSLNYSNGKSLTANLSFWVIPWKLILLGLVGLIVLIYILRLGLRRYNAHIIAKARRHR
jgi:hypothetical protein